jgi:hypothetical protein
MMPLVGGQIFRVIQGPGSFPIIREVIHEPRVIRLDGRRRWRAGAQTAMRRREPCRRAHPFDAACVAPSGSRTAKGGGAPVGTVMGAFPKVNFGPVLKSRRRDRGRWLQSGGPTSKSTFDLEFNLASVSFRAQVGGSCVSFPIHPEVEVPNVTALPQTHSTPRESATYTLATLRSYELIGRPPTSSASRCGNGSPAVYSSRSLCTS